MPQKNAIFLKIAKNRGRDVPEGQNGYQGFYQKKTFKEMNHTLPSYIYGYKWVLEGLFLIECDLFQFIHCGEDKLVHILFLRRHLVIIMFIMVYLCLYSYLPCLFFRSLYDSWFVLFIYFVISRLRPRLLYHCAKDNLLPTSRLSLFSYRI